MVLFCNLDPLTSIFARYLGPFMRKTHFVHRPIFVRNLGLKTTWSELRLTGQIDQHFIGKSCDFPSKNWETLSRNVAEFRSVEIGV
jgi:hypothetical protein